METPDFSRLETQGSIWKQGFLRLETGASIWKQRFCDSKHLFLHDIGSDFPVWKHMPLFGNTTFCLRNME